MPGPALVRIPASASPMDPSRSYTFDQQRPQLSLYPTHPQSPHHPSTVAAPQGLRQHPYQDASAAPSFFGQQQPHPGPHSAPHSAHHTRQFPSYPPSIPTSHLTHTNQQPLEASYPQSGLRSAPAYIESFQYPVAANQWHMNRNVDRRGFIPTPSEIASAYPGFHGHPRHSIHGLHSVNSSPEFSRHAQSCSLGNPMPTHAQSFIQNQAPSSPPPPPPAERFPCDKCDKTFSRSHDRKRHYETQHHPVPVIHRCRYCEKEFSRADSLKRHLDNGCDEMP